LTRSIAGPAITGAALLASSFALSSPAIADDIVPPDTTTEPGDTTSTTQTPTEDPTEPAPDESTPTPTEASPSTTAEEKAEEKKSEEDTAKSDGITAAVEPDFGYNKFRVGVQLEDGSVNPDGLTTLGSEITITETGPNVPNGEVVTTCITTLEDPNEPTTTFCEDLSDFGPPEFNDFYFSNFAGGSTITVEQTGVNDGLEIVDGTKIVVPCGECEEDQGDVLLTDALVSDDDDDDDDGDDDDGDESDDEGSDDPEDGALPNVGAPDAAVLGAGAILLAIGSRLIAGGRSRPRQRGDGAVV
jgi:hypothetical protein